ncbi:MAG: ATP-binding protein [Dehalococcoidia bacterium]
MSTNWMLDRPVPVLLRVAIAPASVALAIGAKFAVAPAFGEATASPYLLVTLAVLISALVGGFRPGLLATLLAAIAVDYFFLEPKYSFLSHGDGQWFQLAIFAAEGVAVSVVGATVQGAVRDRIRLLEHEQEARGIADDGRRRYRELLEGMGVAVYTTGASGRITFFNEAAAELWGRRPELGTDEWCGSWRMYHPDGTPMPHDECPMAVTLREGRAIRGAEAIAERPDGTRVNFIPYPTPLRSSSGEVTGAVNVLVDITARRQAEEQVARLLIVEQNGRIEAELAQRRLSFLSEASGKLTASLKYGLTLDQLPRLAVPDIADVCEIYIFPTEGDVGEIVMACRDPELEELVKEFHEASVPRGGAAHPLRRLLQRQASILVGDLYEPAVMSLAQDDRQREILGKLGLVSYMAVPLVAGGRTIGAMAFSAVDPQKRFGEAELAIAKILAQRVSVYLDNAQLYAESQRAQEELRAAAEAKDEFLGVMSHELRTPITAIMGGARVLRSRDGRLDDETRRGILSDIDAESDRMYRMVENLLALGRLELGQEVSTEPVLTQRVIQKMATSFLQRKPGRTVEVDADELLEPAVASPAYLELVIRNLLSNADKYSPKDEPIEIRATQEGDELEIAVLDRGPGVDPDEANSIFDRFYRSARTSGQAAGVGLGLTVCKRMIEAQSGRVWARPRKGGGSEIGVTLPIYKNGVE